MVKFCAIMLCLCLPYAALYQVPTAEILYTVDTTSVYSTAVSASVTIAADGKRGSGFHVGDGVIVTARHVVEGAEEVRIICDDGTIVPAITFHLSETADIAILWHFGPELPGLAFGNSPAVGDPVFVVGSPLGMPVLRNYVSAGVVSRVGRDVPGFGDNMTLTDAAINGGNSGGPLLNAQGQVIGMVVANVPRGQGIGLCLPASTIQEELARYYGRKDQ